MIAVTYNDRGQRVCYTRNSGERDFRLLDSGDPVGHTTQSLAVNLPYSTLVELQLTEPELGNALRDHANLPHRTGAKVQSWFGDTARMILSGL